MYMKTKFVGIRNLLLRVVCGDNKLICQKNLDNMMFFAQSKGKGQKAKD